MKVGIYGLGYVGCVSAACLGRDGHSVVGVDINTEKVSRFRSGASPVVEPGVGNALAEALSAGRLRAATDPSTVVAETDVSLVCVGTPSNGNGSLNLDYISAVSAEIGKALATTTMYHVVAIRSTVLPGTVEETVVPILEAQSGRKAGKDFGICMNPEFLREGRGMQDYYHPPHVVIGQFDDKSGETLARLYECVDAPMLRPSIRTAEMVKYVSNAFHALKVAFANEMGNLCKAQCIDGPEVMDIFCRDDKLNISPTYLRPGYAFGGSCLPKDVRALLYRAKETDQDTPLLSSVLPSNEMQIKRAIEMVEATGHRRVGVVGLSFKAGTDDVRESPMVTLIETLIGRGYQVGVHDPNVDPTLLVGSNKTFLERELPHIASLLYPNIADLVAAHEVIVLGHDDDELSEVFQLTDANHIIVDLVGLGRNQPRTNTAYHGICW